MAPEGTEAVSLEPGSETPPAGGDPGIDLGAPAGGNGAAPPADGWQSMLSEEMRGGGLMKDFSNDGAGLQQFAERYSQDQDYLRRKGHVEPNWEDEGQVAKFYDGMGRPETAEGYDFSKIEIPEGTDMDPEIVKSLTGLLHKHGNSQRQASGMYGDFVALLGGLQGARNDAAKVHLEQANTALRQEWGNALPANVDIARRALAASLGAESLPKDHAIFALKFEDGTPFAKHPDVVRMLHALGSVMTEGSFMGEKRSTSPVLTPAVAKQQLAEWMADPKNTAAWTDATNIDHKRAVAERTRLVEAQNAE